MYKSLLNIAIAALFSVQANAAIEKVSAISEPGGDGQKVTSMLLQYDKPVAEDSLTLSAFSVSERNIIGIGIDERNPHNVLLMLNPQDPTAALTYQLHKPEPSQQTANKGTPTFSTDTQSVMRDIDNTVEQKIPLKARDGSEIAPNSRKVSKVINQVADDFIQREYQDPATGVTIKYNLFVPENYDAAKSYPLVMFIHDAGATNTNVKNTLYQGNGATSFAAPAAQARQQAFVLAPQFDHVITNDSSDTPPDLDPTINLIKSLTTEYNIDKNRLYTTGQSGGAMMSLAMNIRYPDFFAASWIVAGQWAAEKVAPMAKNNVFVLVSENDAKAFPTEKEMVKVWTHNGAKVAESFGWDGSAPGAVLNQQVNDLLAKGGNIHFAAFKGGSLPLEKTAGSGNKGAAHIGTWKVAYDIDAVRDWLYRQKK